MEKLFREIEAKQEQLNMLSDELKVLKGQFMELMKCEGVDSYMSSRGSVSYVPSSVSYVFDSARFRKDESGLYEKYLTKERVIGEQIRVSQRKS